VISPKGAKKVLSVSSEIRLLRPPTKTVVLLGSVELTPPGAPAEGSKPAPPALPCRPGFPTEPGERGIDSGLEWADEDVLTFGVDKYWLGTGARGNGLLLGETAS
jgi:hypothetical protein